MPERLHRCADYAILTNTDFVERSLGMQQKHLSWIMLVSVVGVVIVGIFILLAVGVLHPTMLLTQEKEPITPEPQAISLVVSFSPSPTPEASPTPSPTIPAYPVNAVNLLVNGTPLMALSNKDAADQLLKEYLSICAYENLSDTEHLIRAYIDASLSVVPVDGTVEYYTYEEAKAKILDNRTLIPIVRSVERAEFSIGTVEATVGVQPSLPQGSRIFRSLGKAEHQFGLSETLYKSGIAVSASQTHPLTRVGSDPVSSSVENGSYVYKEADPSSNNEGPTGPSSGDLKLAAPCKGLITSYFGLHNGILHLGIDYALLPGDTICAPESGTVVFIGERRDYGLVIDIRHPGGFVSRLTHCASPTVDIDQHVFKGDPVAVLALEENNDTPHLHYELIINGIPYNPLQYLPDTATPSPSPAA